MNNIDKGLIAGDEKVLKILESADLIARYSPAAQADSLVFGYAGNNTTNKNHWELKFDEVAIIYATRDVEVIPKSAKKNYGIFRIGKYYNWYYSIETNPDVEIFKESILYLLKYSLVGADDVDEINDEVVMPGGWSEFSPNISEEDMKVFDDAVGQVIGVDYKPFAVAKQVVAGLNYRFICNSSIVAPYAENKAVIIKIFRDLDGHSRITQIKDIFC